MTAKLRNPLLIGGGILAGSIWLLDVLAHTIGEWGIYAIAAGAAGVGVWWLQKQAEPKLPQAAPRVVNSATVQRALVEARQVITQLETEVNDPQEPSCVAVQPQVSLLQAQVRQIATEMTRQEIRLLVMGAKGSGKTCLIQHLQAAWASQASFKLRFAEAPSFSGATEAGLVAEMTALQQAIAADLILFLVTGDMTESEYQAVQRLSAQKRTVLVFNKQDQYPPAERQTILNQLQMRSMSLLQGGDVVAVAAAPNPLKVRQHQADGTVKEWLEDQAPALDRLTQRLEQILQQESQQLVLASSLTSAVALKSQAKTTLNDVRKVRALPIVEQCQWLAAGSAFASPLPSLDVLATAAVNVQMILDLGTLYRQKISFQQAQKLAATLGTVMLKLGLVELSTQAIGALLKTNAFTYLAGGCVQGVSAAYLTRIAGLSLIEYFHTLEPNLTLTEASPLAIERVTQIIQTVFQQNQQMAFLQTFVGQALERLTALVPQPQVAVAAGNGAGANPVPAPVVAVTATPVLPSSPATELRIDENGSGNPVLVSSLESSLPST